MRMMKAQIPPSWKFRGQRMRKMILTGSAHWTAKNLVSKNISMTAAVLWVSISLILLAMVVYIGGVLIEEDWRDRPILFMDIVNFGIVSISLVILLHLSPETRNQTS